MPTYRAARPRLAAKSSAGSALGLAANVVSFHTGDTVAAIHAWYPDENVEIRRR